MYQFLRGIIKEKITDPQGSEKLILDVNGVGYEIQTSLSTLELIGKNGDTVTVYTTLIHKEDQMTLIGFPTLMERELFSLLFSVSGIGPKSALNILNSLTVSEITYSILYDDASILSKANGVGERTASRVILELKEKIKNWKYLPIACKEKMEMENGKGSLPKQSAGAVSEARSVLQALGYSSHEINQAFTNANGHNNTNEDAETLIHFSLKWLSTIKK